VKPVKTYHQVDKGNREAVFSISKMEDIYARRDGKTDKPHRHDFYTVLVIRSAQGTHKVDFNEYKLADQQIFFVAPGQVHQVVEKRASQGFVMTFAQEFLIENAINLSFIESLNLFNDYGHSPPLMPNTEQFQRVEHFTREIFALHESDAKMKEFSIGAFLKLFLIECNAICSVNPIESLSTTSDNSTLKEFKQLVNEHYRKAHGTSYYAELLHITPDHLNRVVKKAIGRTAKEYIQSRITIEAKRLLYFSDLSNKEISFELGFNEPANFSAFFKKCTGYAPSNFIQRERNAF
jgi:AraC-like DNA-binding protein